MKRIVSYLAEVVKLGTQVAFETFIGTLVGVVIFTLTLAIAAALLCYILSNAIK